ncbi:hypothetical protein KIN20_003132 [Parelaphostrongylus tenuis]|uniref:GATA-type domain-containing protein n=1 Tax=Parelaphostrongylus tenuis TaxID=148309 RepID=A0AAD5LYP9_PARTN|nr:hypothetical protein KIN20_003132 [Parelaphostrongylus tenuis]
MSNWLDFPHIEAPRTWGAVVCAERLVEPAIKKKVPDLQPRTCIFSFRVTDLHGPLSYTMTMATVTAPIRPPPVPSATPRSNIVGNAQLPPCDHLRYAMKDKPPRRGVVNADIECANCGTKITSAWRRSAEGESECNACNLFFRKNGRKRPAWMRRDTITRRYRLSRCNLCEAHAKRNPTDYRQIQKAATRHCQNDELSSEGAITQTNHSSAI